MNGAQVLRWAAEKWTQGLLTERMDAPEYFSDKSFHRAPQMT
jgi:hypothetical protein